MLPLLRIARVILCPRAASLIRNLDHLVGELRCSAAAGARTDPTDAVVWLRRNASSTPPGRAAPALDPHRYLSPNPPASRQVEQVYRKCRNAHAGCGRSPSISGGTRRPTPDSGGSLSSPPRRSWSRQPADTAFRVSVPHLFPSRISRSSSASAIRAIASRWPSMILYARSCARSFVSPVDRSGSPSPRYSPGAARSRGRRDLHFLLAEAQRSQIAHPHSQTIRRASSVARSMSLPAPVVLCFRNISSAIRPAISMQICPFR